MLGRSLAIPDSLLSAAIMRPCQRPSARCERAVGARALLLQVLADVLHQADLGPRIRRQGRRPATASVACILLRIAGSAPNRVKHGRDGRPTDHLRLQKRAALFQTNILSQDTVSQKTMSYDHEDDVLRDAAVETELRAAVHLENGG